METSTKHEKAKRLRNRTAGSRQETSSPPVGLSPALGAEHRTKGQDAPNQRRGEWLHVPRPRALLRPQAAGGGWLRRTSQQLLNEPWGFGWL